LYSKPPISDPKHFTILTVHYEPTIFPGFTEIDMEKPKFTFTPQGAKVPFILSEEGESPVIQVRKQLIEIYL